MLSHSYSPSAAKVVLGGQVRWSNTSGLQHTATSKQGFFTSPLLNGNGDSVTYFFKHAGTFGYYCEIHGLTMSGKILVPLKAPTGAANGFKLQWSAVDSDRTNRTFDVQKNAPGTATGWTALRTNTKFRSAFLNPTKNGTWRFRARTDNVGSGQSSGWSPEKLVKVS